MATRQSISQMKYDKANTRFYGLKFNIKTDADLIARITEKGSIQGYIKQLIRDDIARTRSEKAEGEKNRSVPDFETESDEQKGKGVLI